MRSLKLCASVRGAHGKCRAAQHVWGQKRQVLDLEEPEADPDEEPRPRRGMLTPRYVSVSIRLGSTLLMTGRSNMVQDKQCCCGVTRRQVQLPVSVSSWDRVLCSKSRIRSDLPCARVASLASVNASPCGCGLPLLQEMRM